jgi:uncharacterized protein YxeA
MMKKLCPIIILILFVFVSAVTVYAADKLDNEQVYDKDTKSTKQFLVTVTRPSGNESTFKKSYVICGVSEEEKIEDIQIKLLIYDEKSESYVDYKNTDGESTWGLGKYGFFIKEVLLPSEGVNKIRIVAYKESQEKNLIIGKNMQISNFNITVLNEDIKERLKNGIQKLADLVKNVFPIK